MYLKLIMIKFILKLFKTFVIDKLIEKKLAEIKQDFQQKNI